MNTVRYLVLITLMQSAVFQVKSDDDIAVVSRNYEPIQGELGGWLSIYGVRALSNVSVLLLAAFHEYYPDVRPTEESIIPGDRFFDDGPRTGKDHMFMIFGSVTDKANAALEEEVADSAVSIPVCRQVVYVIAHEENPLEFLTPEALKGIFFDGHQEAPKWNELGLENEPYLNAEVRMHGRGNTSSLVRFLRERFEMGGSIPVSDHVTQHESETTVPESVAKDRFALGLVSSPPQLEGLKLIKVDDKLPGSDGYILSRTARLVSPLDYRNDVHLEFMRFVLSESGRKVIREVPLMTPLAQKEYDEALAKISDRSAGSR